MSQPPGLAPARGGVYAITPDTTDTPWLLARVEAVLQAGAGRIQYRNKTTIGPRSRRHQAGALLQLCRAYGVPLLINDDLALAVELGADGVHLGRDDGDIRAARAALGAGKLLGISCYNSLGRAYMAATAGADYVAFGAMFPSATKPGAVTAPLTLLAQARQSLPCQRVAIGGITPGNAASVFAAGADWVAVIDALFGGTDPAGATRALLASRSAP
jgi:thiamine-phosphate pyrophosphorylase